MGSVLDLTSAKIAAKALLNWYVGEVPANVTTTILTVWYQVKINGHELFHSALKSGGTLQYNSPGDAALLEKFTYSCRLPVLSQSNVSADSGLTHPVANTSDSINTSDVIEWYKLLRSALDTAEEVSDKSLIEEAVQIIGFLYMNLMRLTVKDQDLVCRHIYEKSYSAYSALWMKPATVQLFYPPHSKTANLFSELFKKFSANSIACLAAQVYSYGNAEDTSKSAVRGVFRAGNLLALMKTGMGLLHWTQRAASVLKIHMIDLMMFMATDRHTATNKYLIHMMKDFVAPSANQYSWPWARLFWDNAFSEAVSKTNMDYTFVMVSLVGGNSPDSPLWNISSLNCENAAEIKRRAIAMGLGIVDLIIANDGATAQTESARALHLKLAQTPAGAGGPRVGDIL